LLDVFLPAGGSAEQFDGVSQVRQVVALAELLDHRMQDRRRIADRSACELDAAQIGRSAQFAGRAYHSPPSAAM
jgi:hypothetical protein